MVSDKSERSLRVKAEGIELVVPAGSSVSIGRESDSTLTLHDDRVSRRHGVLTTDTQGWIYTDLNSANGSFINGQRVQSVRVGPETIIASRPIRRYTGQRSGPATRRMPFRRMSAIQVTFVSPFERSKRASCDCQVEFRSQELRRW